MAPARAPPQLELELDFEDDADDASFDQVEHFSPITLATAGLCDAHTSRALPPPAPAPVLAVPS